MRNGAMMRSIASWTCQCHDASPGKRFCGLAAGLRRRIFSGVRTSFDFGQAAGQAAGNPVVIVDRNDGSYRVFARRSVVEEVTDPIMEIAKAESGDKFEIGSNFDIEVTPKEFGRIAAQTAKQVIVQRIREAERDMVFDEFNDKVDTLTNGNVLRYEQRNMLIDLDKKAEAILPLSEQVPR